MDLSRALTTAFKAAFKRAKPQGKRRKAATGPKPTYVLLEIKLADFIGRRG